MGWMIPDHPGFASFLAGSLPRRTAIGLWYRADGTHFPGLRAGRPCHLFLPVPIIRKSNGHCAGVRHAEKMAVIPATETYDSRRYPSTNSAATSFFLPDTVPVPTMTLNTSGSNPRRSSISFTFCKNRPTPERLRWRSVCSRFRDRGFLQRNVSAFFPCFLGAVPRYSSVPSAFILIVVAAFLFLLLHRPEGFFVDDRIHAICQAILPTEGPAGVVPPDAVRVLCMSG